MHDNCKNETAISMIFIRTSLLILIGFLIGCATQDFKVAYSKCERFCQRVGTSMDMQFGEDVDFSCNCGKVKK